MGMWQVRPGRWLCNRFSQGFAHRQRGLSVTTRTGNDGLRQVPLRFLSRCRRIVALALLVAATTLAAYASASAEALLLVDIATGRVLHAENATVPWYPASLTKLMTAYVTLEAVKHHRISMNSLVTVSEKAHEQQPSKMGFPAGTRMTVDNALKMMLVKSANDIAYTLAQNVGGSIPAFAAEMNATAERLGMTQTHYVNPNGLPDKRQITSARDLAILTLALIHDFPKDEFYFRIPAIKFGRRVMRNYNHLLGRFRGADGMKTGFICMAGFNLVATATRHGRRLLAIVLGAPSSKARNKKAAELLQSGFDSINTPAWLAPSLGTVKDLKPVATSPPNLSDEICERHHHKRAENEETASDDDADHGIAISSLQTPSGGPLLGPYAPSGPPIVVSVLPPAPEAAVVHPPLPPQRPSVTTLAVAPQPQRSAEPITDAAPHLAGAATIPSAAFSTATIASMPPPDLAARRAELSIPLPRPRPHRLVGHRRRR